MINSSAPQEEKVLENKYARILYYPDLKTILYTALKGYTPIAEFRELFGHELRDFVKREYIKKFIFDKRLMTVFDQPSMTWYHLDWKNEMLKYGLNTYRKLLPPDKLFRFSVQVGLNKIKKDYTEFFSENFNIRYVESLDDAFTR